MSTPKRSLVIFFVLALVAALAAPAFAGPGGKGKGKGKDSPKKGKRAIGVVTAFDPATGAMTLEMRNGDLFAGVLHSEAKVKLEHRGKPSKKGNPTKGSATDITAGDKVLKMKVADDGVTVHRLFLRQSESTVIDAPGGEGDDEGSGTGEEEGDAEEGDAPHEEGDAPHEEGDAPPEEEGDEEEDDGGDSGGETDPVCVDDPATPLIDECALPELP